MVTTVTVYVRILVAKLQRISERSKFFANFKHSFLDSLAYFEIMCYLCSGKTTVSLELEDNLDNWDNFFLRQLIY